MVWSKNVLYKNGKILYSCSRKNLYEIPIQYRQQPAIIHIRNIVGSVNQLINVFPSSHHVQVFFASPGSHHGGQQCHSIFSSHPQKAYYILPPGSCRRTRLSISSLLPFAPYILIIFLPVPSGNAHKGISSPPETFSGPHTR